MNGVLYVSHGSRIKEAIEEAISFIETVKEKVEEPLQETCFLELAEPNIQQGVYKLIKQGANKISIIPVLLLSAGHYFKDIPKEIESIKVQFPDVQFTYGQPLGVQPRLTQILSERIQETGIKPAEDAKILIVGRGSYNPQTQIDISSIGETFRETTGFKDVEVCYLAACNPSFEHTLNKYLEAKPSQIFIAPYLWFTGVLEKHIEQTVNIQETESDVIVCDHLGHHESMKQALLDRVLETLDVQKV